MMNSLRHKIAFGYAAIGALVVALALLSFLELRLFEGKIAASERIGEFFGLALEARRFEKNYFLYHQDADLAENRSYVSQARVLLREQPALFEALDDPAHIARLVDALRLYAELMEEYARDRSALLESRIRHTGKEIVTSAENLSRAERRALREQLDRHRHLLIAAVVAVALLVAVIGQLLARRVARPLKQMEENMAAVAAGRLTQLDMRADDTEVASLTQAFNHVLRELETRRGQLVRSEKLAALGTLLSGVAHELNNPLSNISSSCEILADEIGADGDAAFKQELLGQIDGETWRARRIVRSLLDYARGRDFRRESVHLAQLADDTLRLVKGQIPARVAVERRIADDLVVDGDKQRLQQVLFNLIGNAIEAVAGAGEIVVAARRVTPDRDPCPAGALVFGQCSGHDSVVEIEVRDNGQGIAPEVLPRIFDPFFTTKDVGRGMGLGLFIVFEIVEEHGGCIAVESTPGQGSVFYIRLPQKESPHHD